VLLAIPVSAYGVQAHMEHYSAPKLQKHVVRILWMPCVYGLDSWLALRFKVRATRRGHRMPASPACARRRARAGRRSRACADADRTPSQDHAIYFDTLRECYEAFVIYHFFTFLIVYLEQARAAHAPRGLRAAADARSAASRQHGGAEALLARKEQQPHLFPLSLVLKARLAACAAAHAVAAS
jgi:hypothetical protein